MYLSPLWGFYVGFPSIIDASLYLVVGYTNTLLLLNLQGTAVLQTKVSSPVNCISADKYILVGTSNAFYIMSWDGRMLFMREVPTYFCSTSGDYVAIASDNVILVYKVYNEDLIFLTMFPTSSPVSIWRDKIAYVNGNEVIVATVHGEQLEAYNATYGIKSITLINNTVYTCGEGIYAYGRHKGSLNIFCVDIDADRYLVAATSKGVLLLSPDLRILAEADLDAVSVATFKDFVFASSTSGVHAYYIISQEVDILRGVSLILILIILLKWLWDRRPIGIPPLQAILRD